MTKLKIPLLLDGATGTELSKRGLEGNPPEWILSHPDIFTDLQKGYLDAGSDVIYAPTFGVDASKYSPAECEKLNRELYALSARARAESGRKDALIAGDITSAGLMPAPYGDSCFEDMYERYLPQARALAEAGADIFILETLSSLPEARAAFFACRAVSDIPVMASFSCDKNGRTMMGTDALAAYAVMSSLGVCAFGLNCSSGPEDMAGVLKRLGEVSEIPLIAKPNAGLPVFENGKTVYNVAADEFASYVPLFASYGVCIFGGCCGTDVSHIRALRRAIDAKTWEFNGKGPLLSASESDAYVISPDIKISPAAECTEDIGDILTSDESECIKLFVKNESELQNLAEIQYMIQKPLCISAENPQLLEKALRIYSGRALYDARGGFDERFIKDLEKKYGLIIIRR